MSAEFRKESFSRLAGKYITVDFMHWLEENNFFTAPASISYHGAYEGGLFDHSLAVAENLLELTENLGISWDLQRSPVIVGLFHDICKIDNYLKDDSGKWIYNPHPISSGHGDKSVLILQDHIDLTAQEKLCIRWHMGAFDDKSNWDAYGEAVAKDRAVLFTHTADMIAARIQNI